MIRDIFGVEIIKNKINDLLKKYKIAFKAWKASKHYIKVIKRIKKSGRTKINFAAYVIYDSTYGMDGVFKLMMQDDEHWNPKVVIIPDVLRGEEHSKEQYFATRQFFCNKYGEEYVFDGWNLETNEFVDYTNQFDIIYYANPYDSLVHEYHKIEYATKRNVLPIYVSYGYDVGRNTTLGRYTSLELNLVWKCFADTTYSYEDYLNYQIIKGKNVVLAGYAKMDNLHQYSKVENKRKKILITPHHTVSAKELPLSNFLDYYKLILELPEMFPELDFIFRPHPLLFTSLINSGIWTRDKVDGYLDALQMKGIEYSTGGDYLRLFVESDAIINDCASFTVEWLYTGKPGCFVYNKNLSEEYLTTLMNEAITRYTIAKTEQDIIEFVRRVMQHENACTYKRERWVDENIALNYPRVSDFIYNEISIMS